MAQRARELMKKIKKKVGDLDPGTMDALKKWTPNRKVVMGRARRGLFHGRHIQFGNQISEDGGNKSRRNWKPNVQDKRLFSYILNESIHFKVTTHALRCIDKAGGIDEYLLKTPYNRIDTEMGVFWKARIENLYQKIGGVEVAFYGPKDEPGSEEHFYNMNVAERAALGKFRRRICGGGSGQSEEGNEKSVDNETKDEEGKEESAERSEEVGAHIHVENSDHDFPEHKAVHS